MDEKNDELICACMYVTRNTIESAIRERKLNSVEEVGDYTEAGTNCGACLSEIEDILEEVNGSD